MELLRACWKCGQPPVAGPAVVEAVTQMWVISCPRCGVETAGFGTIEAAAASWNSRPERGDAPDALAAGEGDDGPGRAGELADGLALLA